MTLRAKTFLVMSIAIVCSLAVLYVGSSTLLVRPFIRLDENAARKNAERARDALAEEISGLDAMAADYASWDDTYAFIQNPRAQYIRANMADDTFSNLGIEAVVLVDSSSRVVYSKAMDLSRSAARPLPEGLLAAMAPGKPLVSHTTPKSKKSGVLLLPGGPELVASRPIVAGSHRCPIRGSLLMARRLDVRTLDKIAAVTHLSLSLRPFDDPSLAGDVKSAVLEATLYRDAAAVQQKSGVMSGYVTLDDVYGRPALVLRADGTDAIYRLGRASLRYFLIPLAVIWLLLGLLGMLLLEEFVLSRLAKLSAGVHGIGASGDLSSRVALAGGDELSHVAEAVNGMLSALERSQHELRESEERYRALVEQSSEGVWRLELEKPLPISLTEDGQAEHIVRHGIVAEANDVMAKMHGYEEAREIVGARAADLRDGPAMTEDQIRSFIRGGYRITDSETEQPGPHGRARYFLNNVVGIVENAVLVRAWGTQRDITGRREAEQELRAHSLAINAATDQILITAPDGTIEFVNAAFERETGYSWDEMVGKNARVLESGEHPPAFYEGLWRAFREGETWQCELISKRKGGGLFTADTVISPVKSDNGVIEHFISITRDITQKKLYEEQLDHLAHHDPLTGLPNRLMLSKRLTERLVSSQANSRLLAVMYLDLDRFKFINDTLGHSVGDTLLKLVASRLMRLLRGVDIIARTGGDEFTVVLSGISSSDDAARVAQRILHALSNPFVADGHELFVSASIGISLSPTDGADVETLTKHADAAMYRAKEQGRNTYQFFTQSLSDAAHERLTTEHSLRRALDRNQFEIHYQPRMDIGLLQVLGAEALLRWRQPDGGIIYPAQFIPVAEETGLIVPITEWVLRGACARATQWQMHGMPHSTVEVNVSAYQLHQQELISTIGRVLHETGLHPRYLGLEITEGALMRNPELAIRTLHNLKDMGVRVLIDDFGTGHSSLSHLKRLPVDAVKIDRSFVSNVTTNPDDAAIATAIVAMAHSLKLSVIAEGVEKRGPTGVSARYRVR